MNFIIYIVHKEIFIVWKMYICWSVMCRFSRRVQDSYCSVQNVQDKWALYKGASSLLYLESHRRALYKIEGEKDKDEKQHF